MELKNTMSKNYKFNKERALSWSSISSFEWNPEEWFENYILGKKKAETPEMKFGKEFALSIENGTCTYPGLLSLLPKKKEHAFNVVFSKIPLIGYADAFCDETFTKLHEVKTGKKLWDQKRVNQHGQLDMYLLMNYVTNKIFPEEVEVFLHWCPTEDRGDFSIAFIEPKKLYTFRTFRTTKDIVAFGARIKKTYADMQKYVANHP